MWQHEQLADSVNCLWEWCTANDLEKSTCITESRGRGAFASQLAVKLGQENNKGDIFSKPYLVSKKYTFGWA